MLTCSNERRRFRDDATAVSADCHDSPSGNPNECPHLASSVPQSVAAINADKRAVNIPVTLRVMQTVCRLPIVCVVKQKDGGGHRVYYLKGANE